jgi:hypothetical protein
LRLPARSPNLNAFAERWVRTAKSECLCHFILFGEASLRRALKSFGEHYHAERNHQGKANQLLFPQPAPPEHGRRGVRCQERAKCASAQTALTISIPAKPLTYKQPEAMVIEESRLGGHHTSCAGPYLKRWQCALQAVCVGSG